MSQAVFHCIEGLRMMATDFEIDRNVPPPTDGRGAKAKYPFRDMEVGDSFYVPGCDANKLRAASRYHKSNGRQYTARDTAGGARIWRIA